MTKKVIFYIKIFIKKYFINVSYEKITDYNLIAASTITFLIHLPFFTYFTYVDSINTSSNISNANSSNVTVYINSLINYNSTITTNSIHSDDSYVENYKYIQPYYENEMLDVRPKMIDQLFFYSDEIDIQSDSLVKVKLWINANGGVDTFEVLHSTFSEKTLDKILLKLKKSRFRPGEIRGLKVPTIIIGEFSDLP